MSILSKLAYSLNANPIKIPGKAFVDIDNTIPKFIWKGKEIIEIIF